MRCRPVQATYLKKQERADQARGPYVRQAIAGVREGGLRGEGVGHDGHHQVKRVHEGGDAGRDGEDRAPPEIPARKAS